MSNAFDVAIVGGGPAGLTASIFLARYLRAVLLIDSGDPRNWETRGINGFLGLPGIEPAELRARGRDEAKRYGVEIMDACVDKAESLGAERFVLRTEREEFHSRRVLLAIGLKDVWPDIPGLAHAYGETAHVCPDCDGFEARGKKTVVIGSARKAVGMALNLLTWTNEIIICTNGEPAELDDPEYCGKLDALNVPVLTDRIVHAQVSRGRIYCLELENGLQLDAERIFFAIGQYPADDLGAQLGCRRDAGGHIVVDSRCHTSVLNVFAAGDIVPGPQLAIVAAADGAIAALAVHRSLVPAAMRLA